MTTATATHNFESGQGETFQTVVTWEIDETPVDITGYSARMQLRKRHASTDAAISLTDGDGLELGGAAGTVAVTIAADLTSAIAHGKYVYDIELESPSGVVKRLLKGTIDLSPEVTK
jgi:hypothetical protein